MSETATRPSAAPVPRSALRCAFLHALGLVARAYALRRLGLTPAVVDAARLLASSPDLVEALRDPAVRALFRDQPTTKELALLLRVASQAPPKEAAPPFVH